MIHVTGVGVVVLQIMSKSFLFFEPFSGSGLTKTIYALISKPWLDSTNLLAKESRLEVLFPKKAVFFFAYRKKSDKFAIIRIFFCNTLM